MKTNVLHTYEWHIAPLQNLIDQLYLPPYKPTLSNLQAATCIVTVSDDGQLLGFVACYLNASYPQHLILGNFECQNNEEVATKLFNKAKQVATVHKRKFLLGPMNGSTWFTYRFSILDQSPFFMETIHKSYYVNLWKKYGFTICETYQTNVEDFKAETPLPNVDAFLVKRSLTIRKFDKSQATEELRLLYQFCMQLFADNVLFSPIKEADFIDLYEPILPYLDENLIDFVEDDKEVVGLFFAVKNHYNPKQVIVKTIARNPDEKYKGLANIMSAHFYSKAIDMGYESMLNAYFHLDNKSAHVSQNYGGSLYQSHVLLQLEL